MFRYGSTSIVHDKELQLGEELCTAKCKEVHRSALELDFARAVLEKACKDLRELDQPRPKGSHHTSAVMWILDHPHDQNGFGYEIKSKTFFPIKILMIQK